MTAFRFSRVGTLTALGVLAFTGGGSAQSPSHASALVQKAAGHQSASEALAVAVGTLQAVKMTLEKADHDYGGHRAAAVHDIGVAEHQLRLAARGHAGHKKSTGATAPVRGVAGIGGFARGAHPERQVLSDQQLAQAVPQLAGTVAYLQGLPIDPGGHKAKAIRDLNAAVAQLKTALAFSKAANANKP